MCGVDDEEGNPVGCEMMLAFREILAWGDDYASKSNRASFAELVAALSSFSTDPAPLFASNSNDFKFKSLDFRIPDGGSAATSPLIEAVKRSYGGFGTGFDARTARARRAGSCSCAPRFHYSLLANPHPNPNYRRNTPPRSLRRGFVETGYEVSSFLTPSQKKNQKNLVNSNLVYK